MFAAATEVDSEVDDPPVEGGWVTSQVTLTAGKPMQTRGKLQESGDMIEQHRLPLSTGITMNVALAGPVDAPPVMLVHGFPESHRTWRALVPLLADDLRLVMPDLRGFGASDKPQDVGDYTTE